MRLLRSGGLLGTAALFVLAVGSSVTSPALAQCTPGAPCAPAPPSTVPSAVAAPSTPTLTPRPTVPAAVAAPPTATATATVLATATAVAAVVSAPGATVTATATATATVGATSTATVQFTVVAGVGVAAAVGGLAQSTATVVKPADTTVPVPLTPLPAAVAPNITPNQAFVFGLYDDLLGLAIDPSDPSPNLRLSLAVDPSDPSGNLSTAGTTGAMADPRTIIGLLDSGKVTRADVVRAILESDAYHARQIDTWYRSFFGSTGGVAAPSPEERILLLDAYNHGATDRGIIAILIGILLPAAVAGDGTADAPSGMTATMYSDNLGEARNDAPPPTRAEVLLELLVVRGLVEPPPCADCEDPAVFASPREKMRQASCQPFADFVGQQYQLLLDRKPTADELDAASKRAIQQFMRENPSARIDAMRCGSGPSTSDSTSNTEPLGLVSNDNDTAGLRIDLASSLAWTVQILDTEEYRVRVLQGRYRQFLHRDATPMEVWVAVGDVTADGVADKTDALTDGLLLIRLLFGLSGPALERSPASDGGVFAGMRLVQLLTSTEYQDSLTLRYLVGLR